MIREKNTPEKQKKSKKKRSSFEGFLPYLGKGFDPLLKRAISYGQPNIHGAAIEACTKKVGKGSRI
jgi:hypothetical protein